MIAMQDFCPHRQPIDLHETTMTEKNFGIVIVATACTATEHGYFNRSLYLRC